MAKVKTGVVVGTKMGKTAVVEVLSVRRHPLYLKAVRRTKKFHVHDEAGAKVGDWVNFVETRPISATKRWKIEKVLSVSGQRRKGESIDGGAEQVKGRSMRGRGEGVRGARGSSERQKKLPRKATKKGDA